MAPAAFPMPSARCPALRPIATTTYQRRVDLASSIRLRTSSTPTCRAVWNPNVGTCGGSGRSLSIVFGTCTLRMAPARVLADIARGERCIVAADRDEVRDARLLQHLDHGPRRLGRLGRILARGAQHRPAEQVDARHVVDRERPQPGRVAADEVLEAVADADDFESLVDRLDGRRGDDGVDARGRAAADENAEAPR